jgi:hypothetical protein
MKVWKNRILAVFIGLGAAVWMAGGLAWAQEFGLNLEGIQKKVDAAFPDILKAATKWQPAGK